MSTVNTDFPVAKYGPSDWRLKESFMFMESMKWAVVGPGFWEHGDYPMQHFSTEDALKIARDDFRRHCLSSEKEGR